MSKGPAKDLYMLYNGTFIGGSILLTLVVITFAVVHYKTDQYYELLIALIAGLILFSVVLYVLLKRRFLKPAMAMAEELREREEFYRALFERSRMVKMLIDVETGSIVDANPAAVEFYGYERETLRGMRMMNINALPVEKIREEMARARAEHRFYFLFQHRLASGEIRDVEVYSNPVEFQGRLLLFSTVNDITDRKQAEKTLWESEARFRELFENRSNVEKTKEALLYESEFNRAQAEIARALIAPNSTIDGVAAIVHKWALHLTGSKQGYVSLRDRLRGEFISHILSDMLTDGSCTVKNQKIRFPKDPNGYIALSGHVLNMKHPFFTNNSAEHEALACPPPGHVPIEKFLIVPALFEGEPVAQIALANSDRNYTSEDLRVIEALANLLALGVNRMHTEEELVLERNKAEAASKAKSEFLANMSHEIRTPLAAIVGMADMVLSMEPCSQIKECLDAVKDASGSLLSLINDILDLSKIEAARIEIRHSEFDLASLLSGIMGMFKAQAHQKGLLLSFNMAPDVPARVIGDPMRLRQILTNLVGNALKFTDRGEVKVKVERLDRFVPSDGKKLVKLRFAVTDTGIGIPEEKHSLLFKNFEQLDDSRSRKYGGTGLGLAICKKLLEMMNGEIGFESKIGRGSTFFFTLALEEDTGQIESSDSGLFRLSEPPTEMNSLNILLTEDNSVIEKHLTYFLSQDGHKITAATNGVEALAALEQERFDLVLMDIEMPEMDGIEATRRIRNRDSERIDPSVPIVALTAHAMKGDRERILKSGMNDYIVKPVKMEDLRFVIGRVLTSRQVKETSFSMSDAESCVVDLTMLKSQYAGLDDLLQELIRDLSEDLPKKVQVLKESMATMNIDEISKAVHGVVGLAGPFYAQNLIRYAKELERAAKRKDIGNIRTLFDRVDHESRGLMQFLSSELQKL